MDFLFLSKTSLFKDISESDIKSILKCLHAKTHTFEKGEYIYHCGQKIENIGMVLSGSAIIESNDLWGNCSVISHIDKGHIFAESYSCTKEEAMLVNVVAIEKTQILFLNTSRLIKLCASSCVYHNLIIKNLLQISAQKNIELSRRILYTSSKTIRGRLMTFFSDKVKQTGSYTIKIPFNRQMLADYLGVDRSAMCNELSKMQKEGYINYNKNLFELVKNTLK